MLEIADRTTFKHVTLILLLLLLSLALTASIIYNQHHFTGSADSPYLSSRTRKDPPLVPGKQVPEQAALKPTHLCEAIARGETDGFRTWRVSAVLQQLGLLSSKPLILCPGAGTTATKGLFHSLCRLGILSVHWSKLCLPRTQRQAILSTKASVCQQQHETSLGPEPPARIMVNVTSSNRFPSEEAVNTTLKRLFAVANHSLVSAVLDTPFTEFFWDIFHMFPNSKVILTVRDVEEWAFKRVREHPQTHSILPISRPFGHVLLRDFTRHQRAYQLLLHHALIACLVPSDRLLVVDYFQQSEADIEQRLIKFLGLPNSTVPDM